MQPTEMSDFFEKVAELLRRAPADHPAPAPDKGSLLASPMRALAESRSFAEVFGSDNRLFERLAEEAEAQGDAALAGLLRSIEAGLVDASLRPPEHPAAVRRFSGFVYPVI